MLQFNIKVTKLLMIQSRAFVSEITICIDQLSCHLCFVFFFLCNCLSEAFWKCYIIWFLLSLHQSFVDCLTCFIFLLLGNKWNLKKFVPYSETLENISQKWPNIERLSDHPNDTSKVFVQISLWYLIIIRANISPFLIGSNPLVNLAIACSRLAMTKFGKQLQNRENDVNNTE